MENIQLRSGVLFLFAETVHDAQISCVEEQNRCRLVK